MKGREVALDIIDQTMERLDAYGLTRDLIKIENDNLKVSTSLDYDLRDIKNIYVLGGGKAVIQIAEALEDILEDKITEGLVVEKKIDPHMERGLERIKKLRRIEVIQGGHPVPNEDSVRGAERILKIAQRASVGDIVFFCVQGGCTSLTTLPVKGVSLEDIITTNNILLKSGADVKAINKIRTAITVLSHGRLAPYIYPAKIINLIVKDAVKQYPKGPTNINDGWGPTVPIEDPKDLDIESTVFYLKSGGFWKSLPSAVKRTLERYDPHSEAQTVAAYRNKGIIFQTFILADPVKSAEEAKKAATLNSYILSTSMEGESKDVGILVAGIAKDVVAQRTPCKPPCAIILSGEMTVTIVGEHGEGGRNQEAVLSAALKIDGSKNIVIASVGTDGTDGPTSIAGGVVDGYTCRRARDLSLDLTKCLHEHNSSYSLTTLGDAIYFNEPGSNVCDLLMVIVTD